MPTHQVADHAQVGDRGLLDVDHSRVHPVGIEIEHVGDPPGHSRGDIPAGPADDDHSAAGHVLTAMVTNSLDHGSDSGVPHAEPLPHDAAYEQLAPGGAVRGHVASDHVLFGGEGCCSVRAHDYPAARQPLGQVVVGVALQPQRDTSRKKGSERLAGGADQGEVDRRVGQPDAVRALGDLVTQHGPDGPVDVAHVELSAQWHTGGDGVVGHREQQVVKSLLQPVILAHDLMPSSVVGQVWHVQERGEVKPGRLPVLDRRRGVQQLGVPDRFVQAAEAERRQMLPNLLGQILEERDDELRLAAEALP